MNSLHAREACKAPGQQRGRRHGSCSSGAHKLEGETGSDRQYRSVVRIKQINIYKAFPTCWALFKHYTCVRYHSRHPHHHHS